MNDYNIKKLYEDMEIELIASMQKNLSRHLKEEKEAGFEYTQWQAAKLKELKRYQRENKEIIGGYTKGLNKKISDHLQSELRQGSIDAIKEWNKYNKDNKKTINRTLNKSFFKTNDRKVNALIKSINNDLNKANTAALRMTNDEYRQIIHKSAFFNANGIKTEKQAAKMAVEEIPYKKIAAQSIDEASQPFLSGGLNCIEYKNGRRVNIASYAEMAVRTASLRAHLMGEGDFRKSMGLTLVKVSSHGGCCDMCARWEGQVLVDDVYSGGEPDGKHDLLSDAMADGLFHPNCMHGIYTYYPELEEIKEEAHENDDLQNKINYYDRQEKRFERLSTGSIDEDNKKEYKQKQIACVKKKDEVLKIELGNNIIKHKDYLDAIKNGYWDSQMKYCYNATDTWIGKVPNKINKVVKHKNYEWFNYKGKSYYIDNHNIKIQFKNGEEKFADILATLTNKRIELFPRFDMFRSTDAKIGKEYVDFKITTSGTDKFIYNNISEAKTQSNHFIIWVKNKEISEDVVNYQVDNVFRKLKNVKTIGIYQNDKLSIYKRK